MCKKDVEIMFCGQLLQSQEVQVHHKLFKVRQTGSKVRRARQNESWRQEKKI